MRESWLSQVWSPRWQTGPILSRTRIPTYVGMTSNGTPSDRLLVVHPQFFKLARERISTPSE
jgi:hypothetical protein